MVKIASQGQSNQRFKESYTLLRYEKPCKQCGNVFLGNGSIMFCCKDCKNENRIIREENKRVMIKDEKERNSNIISYEINTDWQNKKMKEKFCKQCGEEIYGNMKTKFCCKDCHKENIKLNRQVFHKEECIKICEVCGESFSTNREYHKICSDECRRIKAEKINSLAWFEENNESPRNFLKLRFEIFKRDNFTCQYCGRNVKNDKIKIHVDHIIPKAKDGKNVITNLITSCEECNLGKRDCKLNDVLLRSYDE